MRVFALFPSATTERGNWCARIWRLKGYDVAIYSENPEHKFPDASFVLRGNDYPGYWGAVNRLVEHPFVKESADVFVAMADDMEPD